MRRPPPPDAVDKAIARFDEVMGRIDRGPAARARTRRRLGDGAASVGRRLGGAGIAVVLLIVATLVFSQMVGPIGLLGLFVVVALMAAVGLFAAFWPGGAQAEAPFAEDMPNQAVVRRLDELLVRRRPELPAPAALRLDAITAQLPLLEQRLADVPLLDPVAQDARRLMGQHLPDLLERYERVPLAYRRERFLDDKTLDERLVAGLDAARVALDDIGRKLAAQDVNAFETQGRFIESRYRDTGPAPGS